MIYFSNKIFVDLDTLFQIKRIIGRKFNDSSVQTDIKHFPFTVIERHGRPIIKVDTRYGEKLFTPEEISAMILGKMRDIAVSLFNISHRKYIDQSFDYSRKDFLAIKLKMLL